MLPYFPRKIAYRALTIYLASLGIISVLFFRYLMKPEFIVLGLVCVAAFFLFTSEWSKYWQVLSEKRFVRKVFTVAVIIRLVWVVFSYFYYQSVTGIPFEFGAADSTGYHGEAEAFALAPWNNAWEYYFGFGFHGFSDVGYPLYLTLVYKIFGPVIIIPRILKALMSAYMCVLAFRLCNRTFGEATARLAMIMFALMPNLIIYCGYHLKETEMLFLVVLFLERADHLIRSKDINLWTVLVPSLLALSMFFFRTVLGAAAAFSLATAVLFSQAPSMKKGLRRASLVGWGILCVLVAGGGTIMTELESYWEDRDENVSQKRFEQTSRGNQWAKYATGSVMAPMVFVLPFSTMVNVDEQYGQQEKNGGNYVRNFMGIFALLAVYEAIRRKKWRDFSLIGSFVIAYLGVVSLSGFSNSERFLLPGLPCLIMMWAYGITTLRPQTIKWVPYWSFVVLLMEVGWAYFKLGSRGLF